MIGFVGGTGPEGRGLALRFAMAGHEVIIGSRNPARAHAAAQEVASQLPGLKVSGAENGRAAQAADIVFLAIPYSAHQETVAQMARLLEGKVVVDVVVPLVFKGGRAQAVSVPEGSVAEQAQALLTQSQVVGAFHSISAHDLLQPQTRMECDVVVCADDPDAKRQVMALAELIAGVRAVDGNGLECSRYAEALTALLLNINRVYKSRTMIKLVGI